MNYCIGLIGLIFVMQLVPMDRPPRLQPKQANTPARPEYVIDYSKFEDFLKEVLAQKELPLIHENVYMVARIVLFDDNKLREFAEKNNISKQALRETLEMILKKFQEYKKIFLNKREIRDTYKLSGLSEQQIDTLVSIIALVEDYNASQKFDVLRTERYMHTRTREEIEFINKNLNAALSDKLIIPQILSVFQPIVLSMLKNIQFQSTQFLSASAQQKTSLTKKQQQNADFLYELYNVGRADLETYLPLKTNSELDRTRSFLLESKLQAVQDYLLQKMTQNQINDFQHIFYKVEDILKSRSKPKLIPNGLSANDQLLYKFVENYIKEGDKLKLNYTDQEKNNIKEAAQAISNNPDSLNSLAAWLSLKPNSLKIILERVKDLFKKNELPVVIKPSGEIIKNPWPEYPQEELSEKAALPKLAIVQEPLQPFNVQNYINQALDNNAKLNALIQGSSDEQLNVVLGHVDALIKADEKVIRKYQDRFEVTPRKDLAKLRLLMQSIDQELKRRTTQKEEFLRQNINKPHPEYPQSPR